MNSPLISIIVPTYNSEKYVAETIRSCLNQTYKNIEVICVNDGSTDNSLQIVEGIFSDDNRLKIFSIENAGQCYASNFGVEKSSGEYIKFVDADDIISSNHIELQFNAIKKYPDHIASCEWGRFYDNPLNTVFKSEKVWEDLSPIDWLKKSELFSMMGGWLWLIPKSVFYKAGGWNEELTLNNDFDFSIRIILASKGIRFAKGAKLYYRSGHFSGEYSKPLSAKAIDSAYLTTVYGCNNYLKTTTSKETKLQCANRFQHWYYTVYPYYPNLSKKFKIKVNELGGSNLSYQSGGIFKIIKKILGLKIALFIKMVLYKMGYKPKNPIHKYISG